MCWIDSAGKQRLVFSNWISIERTSTAQSLYASRCTQVSGDTSLWSLLIYTRSKSKTKNSSKNKEKLKKTHLTLPNAMQLIPFANNVRSHAIHQISPSRRMPSHPAWRGWMRKCRMTCPAVRRRPALHLLWRVALNGYARSFIVQVP